MPRSSGIHEYLLKETMNNEGSNIAYALEKIRLHHKHLAELVDKKYVKQKKSRIQHQEDTPNTPGIVYEFILKKDGSFNCPFISEEVYTILGWSPKEVKANPYLIFDNIFSEDQDLVNQSITKSTWTEEFRIQTKKREIKWFRANFNPHLLPDGNILLNGVFIDVTERKRLREEMAKTQKLAAIGQLASIVAHEIRNPLGVMKNSIYFLSMKLKNGTDKKVMKHLKILEKEIRSANLIICDLLDFARKKPPTLDRTDLNQTVTSALTHDSIPEKIKVTLNLDEIPSMLLDREQIRRVFQNLILNAIQAMSEGGKLTIQTSKHNNSAEITFNDTGIGIPKENLPKLFTAFFSTKAKGVGLGLTICKQIVKNHGGNITVKSKANKGSTFIVKLPIRSR